jgi:Xaa-Pro aminopeptidase
MATRVTRRRPAQQKTDSRAQASHDTANPKALIDFMMKSWQAPLSTPVAPVEGLARFRARREKLSAAFLGDWLFVPAGHEKIRNTDNVYRFRPASDFYYLTGNKEPDCVLVLSPKGKKGHDCILYVEPNPGRSNPTFFTDRAKGELWVGPRLGLPQSRERFGVEKTAAIADLGKLATRLKAGHKSVRVLRGIDPILDGLLPGKKKQDKELAIFLSEQRLIKDESEIAALVKAAECTRRAYEDVIRDMRTATTERELEGTFDRRARIEGNDVGYGTIVAAGAHACILHWTRNDGLIKAGDLLLVDAGIEGNDLYTADVTRTLPISGTFSQFQREVYDLVIEGQNAALAEVKPGNDYLAPHRASTRALALGLERLKILPMSAEEALKEENQFHKRYTLHNTSHMLGLDVHDCANARPESYKLGKLKPGMVITVEPGLYFQLDDLTVPEKYRGIGIRVEENVLVTESGYRLLNDLPRTSQDVEKWISDIWQRN